MAFLLLMSSCKEKIPVDFILHHGKVYTMDSTLSTTEAFAVKDGKIIDLGGSYDILGKYKATKVVDARNQPVYPGFIDAHAHFLGYGKGLFQLNLFDCKSWEEALKKLDTFVSNHPDEQWIIGRGWDQNLFPGKAFPDNQVLNTKYPNKYILLSRVDGHAAIANQAALDLAHITPATQITGGSFGLNQGKLTGLLIDNAVDLVKDLQPKPTRKDYEKWLVAAETNCLEQGLTSVADCGLMHYEVEQIDSLQRKGKLKMRLYVMLSDNPTNFEKYLNKPPYKTEHLYVKGIKAYADGALGSRGACLLHPYSDQPNWQGFLLSNISHFDSLAAMLAPTDFQLCTHAIGDSGNRMVLNIYKKYLKEKNNKRWRIEHAQVVSPDDIPTFGAYSIIPSVQPTHATSDMNWAGARLGKERIQTAYAYKSLLQQNGWIPLGTDFPVEDIVPFKTLKAAVARTNGQNEPKGGFQIEQGLTIQEALRGVTIWAAKANSMETEIGSLEKGKRADFIILSENPMTVPANELDKIRVYATYINAEKVYGQ